MRRTARVEDDLPATTRSAHRVQKITWKVRERRLRHIVPVMYRVGGTGDWLNGVSENLSRSGLLFRSPFEVQEGAAIEIKLEMPEELAGDSQAEVLCKASVARVNHIEAAGKESESFLVACAIEDYDFAKKPVEHATDSAALSKHPSA
jgi:PilZ domain